MAASCEARRTTHHTRKRSAMMREQVLHVIRHVCVIYFFLLLPAGSGFHENRAQRQRRRLRQPPNKKPTIASQLPVVRSQRWENSAHSDNQIHYVSRRFDVRLVYSVFGEMWIVNREGTKHWINKLNLTNKKPTESTKRIDWLLLLSIKW